MGVVRNFAVLLTVIGLISPGADGACDQAAPLKCQNMVPQTIPGANTAQDEYCGIMACGMECLKDAIADCPSTVKELLNPTLDAVDKECPGYICDQSLMRNSSSSTLVSPGVDDTCSKEMLKCNEKIPKTIPGAKTAKDGYCGAMACSTECMRDALAECPSVVKTQVNPMLEAADNQCPGYTCNSSSLPQMTSSIMTANLVLVVAYWSKLI